MFHRMVSVLFSHPLTSVWHLEKKYYLISYWLLSESCWTQLFFQSAKFNLMYNLYGLYDRIQRFNGRIKATNCGSKVKEKKKKKLIEESWSKFGVWYQIKFITKANLKCSGMNSKKQNVSHSHVVNRRCSSVRGTDLQQFMSNFFISFSGTSELYWMCM